MSNKTMPDLTLLEISQMLKEDEHLLINKTKKLTEIRVFNYVTQRNAATILHDATEDLIRSMLHRIRE